MSDSLLFEYEISGVKYEISGVKLAVAITAAQNCQVSSNIAANLTIFADATATQLPKGGTLIFTAYVGSDPASTVHPKKYQEFQAPQKIFGILVTQKNIPILYLDLKKGP